MDFETQLGANDFDIYAENGRVTGLDLSNVEGRIFDRTSKDVFENVGNGSIQYAGTILLDILMSTANDSAVEYEVR